MQLYSTFFAAREVFFRKTSSTARRMRTGPLHAERNKGCPGMKPEQPLPLVIPLRFERRTHALEGRCSIQLSYGTNLIELRRKGSAFLPDMQAFGDFLSIFFWEYPFYPPFCRDNADNMQAKDWWFQQDYVSLSASTTNDSKHCTH